MQVCIPHHGLLHSSPDCNSPRLALKADRRTPLLSRPLADNQGFEKVG